MAGGAILPDAIAHCMTAKGGDDSRMAKRSITDEEIALIKAMLAKGMKNKDIQFFFNRPDRSVNSGRITGIRTGSYANSAHIAAASAAALDAFIAANSRSGTGSSSSPHTNSPSEPEDPLSPVHIEKHFKVGADGLWRLSAGETERCECKAGFGFRYQDKWLRPIAALANNAGGYVFFGVHDKDGKGPLGEDWSHAVVGLDNDEFGSADPANFSARVKAMFDPTPVFQAGTVEIGGKTIGVIHVRRHESRPVIAVKQEGSIKEGDIFYRYPGQSSRIKYSDLRAMLDARDAEARAQILPMVERLLKLGPARAMVADLDLGVLQDGNRSIHIDQSLVDKLTFIKEGEFSETDGAPTLRLVGDVSAVSEDGKRTSRLGILTRADIISAFLEQVKPVDPKEYIRFAIEVGQGERLPLHYFARLAGLSQEELVKFINSSGGPPARKQKYVNWLSPHAAFRRAVGSPKAILDGILAGATPSVTTPTEASHAAQAIVGIPRDTNFDFATLLGLARGLRPSVSRTPTSWRRPAISRSATSLRWRD